MKFACESTHKETHKDILQYRFRGTVTFCVKYRGTVTFCVGVEMKTLPVNVIVCLHMHNSNRKIGNRTLLHLQETVTKNTENPETRESKSRLKDYRGGLDRSGEGLLFIIHRTSTTNHGPPAYTHPLRIHIVLAYTHTQTGAYTHPMWMLHCVLANTHTHTDRSRMHPLRIRTRSRIRTYRSRIRTYPRIRTLRTLRCVFARVHLRFPASLAVRVARTGGVARTGA